MTDREPLTLRQDGDRLVDVNSEGREAQRDPLVRIARALELYAVTSTFRALAPSDARERAWRAMGALVREVEGDACGPQDVVRQR